MTGFTLGGETGATLGGTAGGTLGTRETRYPLRGFPIGETTSETATTRTLTLSLRVRTGKPLQRVRELKTDEGKLSVLTTGDGGYQTVDRADGANTFTLTPPPRRRPLRRATEYHVASYDEELVSSDLGEFDVEIEFVASETRRDTNSIDETPAADEFGLTTRYGTIAADARADLLGTGRNGVEKYELVATLTFKQATAFVSAVNRLAATRVQTVADGTNRIRDESSDDAATLTIDAPGGQDTVPDSTYVVVDWSTTRLNDAFEEVSLTVAPAAE